MTTTLEEKAGERTIVLPPKNPNYDPQIDRDIGRYEPTIESSREEYLIGFPFTD